MRLPWESPGVRASAMAGTTHRVWTPGSLPATLRTTRRERAQVPACERVAWQRVLVPPPAAEARLAGAPTARARGCTTAGLVQPVTERRGAWAALHGLPSGEAQ